MPILIHGGRGLPPIADALGELDGPYAEAQLIIAHAGIADLAALARNFAGEAGVFFDTSTWSPVDLLDFYRPSAPEQVVYASDYPYGRQPNSLHSRCAPRGSPVFAEESPEHALGQRGADRRRRGAATAVQPHGPRPSPADQLARIHQYLTMATPLLWTRQADTIGVLGLALNTCGERDGPGGARADRELLRRRARPLAALPEADEAEVRTSAARPSG